MAACAPFEPRPQLAVAVSGGRDSLALALLADSWARDQGGRATALTVDHGLRDGSAAEAHQVRRWLAVRGIATRILAWQGPKPTRDIAAAARAARYALLEEWCRKQGVLHLLVAQQADDQAETLLLRLGRGSGLFGLAAMPAIAERTHVRLLRPLLTVPRDRLGATLTACGQKWIDEPGNTDLLRARARVRAALPALAGDGLDTIRLARTAHELGRARVAVERAVAELLAAHGQLDPAGFFSFASAGLSAASEEVTLRALASALTTVAGALYPPRAADLERLLRVLIKPTRTACTLGGCQIFRDKNGLMVARETAAATHELALIPGSRALWDGRFLAIVGGEAPAGLRLAPIGLAQLKDVALKDVANGLPRAIIPALPAVWRRGKMIAVPLLDWAGGRVGARALAAVRLEFYPRRPLTEASFGIV